MVGSGRVERFPSRSGEAIANSGERNVLKPWWKSPLAYAAGHLHFFTGGRSGHQDWRSPVRRPSLNERARVVEFLACDHVVLHGVEPDFVVRLARAAGFGCEANRGVDGKPAGIGVGVAA